MKKFYTLSLLLPAVLFLMPSALKAQTEAPEVTAAQKELDKMTISKLLGHHWSGRQLPEDGMENVYLVNVKTGEYLVAGDYWGTASMLDHVGLRFSIQPAAGDGRIADHPDNVIEHGSYTGYWIGLHDVNDGRVLGRAANGDGKWGAFENMRYIFAREKKEYIRALQHVVECFNIEGHERQYAILKDCISDLKQEQSRRKRLGLGPRVKVYPKSYHASNE